MALEPLDAASVADDSELRDMNRRFRTSVVFTAPLLAITMSEFVPGLYLYHRIGMNTFNWVQAAFATPVVLWGGWPFFVRAWASFRTWRLNMFSLIGLGTAAAFLFSVGRVAVPRQPARRPRRACAPMAPTKRSRSIRCKPANAYG